jgi:hypothetical protein
MARIKTVLTERFKLHEAAIKAYKRLNNPEPLEEGEYWVELDELEKKRIYWNKPWFRQKQRHFRNNHPMF